MIFVLGGWAGVPYADMEIVRSPVTLAYLVDDLATRAEIAAIVKRLVE